MHAAYIEAAMRRAQYETLSDGSTYGQILGFRGVYANAATREACRTELQEVLEGWIVLSRQLGHKLPLIEGIEIDEDEEAS